MSSFPLSYDSPAFKFLSSLGKGGLPSLVGSPQMAFDAAEATLFAALVTVSILNDVFGIGKIV